MKGQVSRFFVLVTIIVISINQIEALFIYNDFSNGQIQNRSNPIQVRFVLSARNLPKETEVLPRDYPDGYVKVVYFRSPGSPASEEYTTEVINNNLNPDWLQVFDVHFIEGHGQRFLFTIMDEDIGTDDDEIGTVEVSLKEIVNSRDNRMFRNIIGKRENNGVLQIDCQIGKQANEETILRLTKFNGKPQRFGTVFEVYD